MKTCTPQYSSPTFIVSLILILITINIQTTSAYSYSTEPTIFRRQTACGSDPSGSTPCEVQGFCCPSDTRCIPIENKTSVVCCKKGEYCDQIYPINCPSSPSTTRSASASETFKDIQCGDHCCPLGYECGLNGDRCLMKQENIPDDHKKHREDVNREESERILANCRERLGQGTNGTKGEGGGKGRCDCDEFPTRAVLVGLFPGVALGVAIMFGYTKIVEMKTRRRTINFNNPSPDDLSWTEGKPNMQQHESISIGYSPHLDHQESRNILPANWKPITPADLSPNLGPTIPPREIQTSRDRAESRMANSGNTTVRQTPSPHPFANSPLEARAQSAPRSSTDSETDHSESFLSSTISNTRASSSIRDLSPQEGPSNRRRYFSSETASVITDAGPVFSDMDLNSRIMLETETVRGRSGISTETGYSDSVYQDGSSAQAPFVFEDEGSPFHVSRTRSPPSAVREQGPYANPFSPSSPIMESPFAGGTPPSRFGGF